MTTEKQSHTPYRTFLFHVEILMEDEQHGTALEKLLHSLNSSGYLDYRISSGIQLGQFIEQRVEEAPASATFPVTAVMPATQQYSQSESEPESLSHIRTFIKRKTLIRLIVNRGLGIKLNIPCRIINMDEDRSLVTVYHVDEKQVYTFSLSEIEDFLE